MHAWLGVPLLALWRVFDLLVPKRMDRWAFFVHPLKPGQFTENARAVYEHVRHDPSIERWIFVRGGYRPPGLEESAHTRVQDLDTLAGLWALARCGVLLLTNSTSLDMSMAWKGGGYSAPRPWLRRRVVVNLWHGIPLKRLFAMANPAQRRNGDRNRFRRRERRHYDGLVASSPVDGHAMATIFHPLPPSRVWVTGLPRTDFLRMDEAVLPDCLREELLRVRALRDGRRLVLYAPTYRDASVAHERCYRFSDIEVQRLKRLLARHDAVLGVRGHYLANAPSPFDRDRDLDGRIFELEHDAFHEIAPLLRQSAVVLTDYSSVYIDALYLELPVVSFAWDADHFRDHQNGLLYDMDLAFPGPVATDFDALLAALDAALSRPANHPDPHYCMVRRMFFQHDDSANSHRLVERLRQAVAARGAR
ncbi:CDP-glycerol glycerophosphotransferase family protein [Pseudoxanthomonas daejeonensis]|uniref:CDP-glycerol glycerophosphotransferase family protein n=1 Tax=Pseudoxanthomonas daejeonensis TaxID=266062 RepID=UPI001EE431AD|nr:CDP-glycerol glycerophosphotransferase family protein [Pseudoxanthomonas daejeonensis]